MIKPKFKINWTRAVILAFAGLVYVGAFYLLCQAAISLYSFIIWLIAVFTVVTLMYIDAH